jgi:hypothetical protein
METEVFNSRIGFTNGTLAAGQHLVLFADNNSKQGPLHAPFKMNTAGDQLTLTGQTATGGRYLIDSDSLGAQTNNISWARLGCGGSWVPSTPTPREGNVSGSWRTLVRSNNFVLAFPTRAGANYTVQFKDDLKSVESTSLPAALGLGLEQIVEVPVGTTRFFRVREE